MKKLMSGAQILLECLHQEGCDVIFGYPGGVLLPIYDAIYDRKDIKHILVRHEQGAAHAADGYARASGKVGVCLATSGPGATNLITGIATANMDSIPMVCITGQVRTANIGTDAFQEADSVGITLPIVKYSYLVKKTEDLPGAIAEAFYIARTGRPGPTLVDLPVDVSNTSIEWSPEDYKPSKSHPYYQPQCIGDLKQIKALAKAINDSEKPVLYVGGGIISSGAQEELTKLSELTNIYVTNTLMGKGAIDETHVNSLGMLGMHGSAYANYAVHHCDLLIGIGARFDDRVTGKVDQFAPNAFFAHIEIDPAEIGKVVRCDIPIIGDAKVILTELLKHVEPKPRLPWNDRIDKWKKEFPLWYPDDENLYAPFLVEQINRLTNYEAIMVTDVGQHQMWAGQWFKSKRARNWLSSGGLGTMGYGLPAAIGAQLAHPEKRVICFTGDGSIQMNSQEFMTAVVYKLPIIVVINNNRSLGMVRQWQELFWNSRFSHTDMQAAPDFMKLIDAYGGIGFRVTTRQEAIEALTEALKITDRPIVVEAILPTEEKVWPMVPSGQPVDQMMVRRHNLETEGDEWSFADEEKELERLLKKQKKSGK